MELKMKGVFLDRGTFPDDLSLSPPPGITQWREYRTTSTGERLERLRGCDLAVVNKVVIDADLIEQLPDLKCIAVTATGTNNIDLDASRRAGITVFNATGYAADAVAEHVVMLIFALVRNLKAFFEDERELGWSKSPFFCHMAAPIGTVAGKTLVVMGRGALGQATADRAKALGMKTLYAERPQAHTVRAGYTPFEEALANADVLSLHCPLTPETEGLINRRTLALMKPGALLINTGRGALVNEADLLAALKAGDLAGAGLDVASEEPPPTNHPIWQLARHSNVILTPHIAWATHGAMRTLLRQIEEKLDHWMRGELSGDL